MSFSNENQKSMAQIENTTGLLGKITGIIDVAAMYSKGSYQSGGYQRGKRSYTSIYNLNVMCADLKFKVH